VRRVLPAYPLDLLQALADLGSDLRDLRRLRRIPMAAAATQVRISRSTLAKVERGDPSVCLGIYARILQRYGMLARLAALAEARFDRQGLAMERERLPQRVRGNWMTRPTSGA
jgi:transcriptional regulator with XRE-family HTH domain